MAPFTTFRSITVLDGGFTLQGNQITLTTGLTTANTGGTTTVNLQISSGADGNNLTFLNGNVGSTLNVGGAIELAAPTW